MRPLTRGSLQDPFEALWSAADVDSVRQVQYDINLFGGFDPLRRSDHQFQQFSAYYSRRHELLRFLQVTGITKDFGLWLQVTHGLLCQTIPQSTHPKNSETTLQCLSLAMTRAAEGTSFYEEEALVEY